MSRVLIVTGGSRGLGAATCIAAAEQGYEAICVNYVANKSRADEVVAACENAGAKAIAVQADVAQETDVVRLFETVDKELGAVTHLVNSAGIIGPYGRIDELKAADLTPDDETVQLKLAETLAAERQFDEAFEVCLGIVERDRDGLGQQARDALVTFFGMPPANPELVSVARRRLATLLY